MLLKHNINIDKAAITSNLKRLINQIYKLLPSREQNLDWMKPLDTIIEEFAGMSSLLTQQHETLFSLLCKLEGLKSLTSEQQFQLFRRIIFESIGLVGELKQHVES